MYNSNITFRSCMAIVICTLLTQCTNFQTKQIESKANDKIAIALTPMGNSDFNRVDAHFYVEADKTTAFKVISDLAKTPLWLNEVSSIRTLKIYDFNNFLLQTILDSPWPFEPRETITCVATRFDDTVINIAIKSCNERYPESHNAVRVSQLISHWKITQIDNTSVRINYSAWLDPAGNVPAYFFNRQLPSQTKRSMSLLKQLIEEASDISVK